MNKQFQLWLLAVTSLALLSCKSPSSSSASVGGGGATSSIPSNTVIAGSLQIEPSVSGSSTAPGAQNVQLVSDNDTVYAEGKTTEAGTFALHIKDGAALTATGTSTVPKFLYVKSLFVVPSITEKTAVGVRNPIVLDGRDLTSGSNGEQTLDTGTHVAQKVGAIYGKITLETAASPVGIDVYVPGTTHIAKTDLDGTFLLGFLPQGTYLLRAEKAGFTSQQWNALDVPQNETINIGEISMQISTGPKVEAFALKSLDADTGKVEASLRLSKASKYRISKFSDFGDTVFAPYSANALELTVPLEIDLTAKMATIYLQAADDDGLTASSSFTIDRQAPLNGSVVIATANGFVNSSTLNLTLASDGATKMRFAESAIGLASGAWSPYKTSTTYTLSDRTEGARRLYVAFSDDSGNVLAGNGEISAAFIYDVTAPSIKQITLLTPESPTGDFDKMLLWTSTFTEDITYEVEIYSDINYTTKVRPISGGTLETTSTQIRVSPVFADSEAGTYYWRVRARDGAGNESAWVQSGAEKAFTLRILSTSFQARRSYSGNYTTDSSGTWLQAQDYFFGREIASLGDLNGSGTSNRQAEIAYSIMSAIDPSADASSNMGGAAGMAGTAGGMNNGGAVEVRDVENNHVISRLSEQLYGYELYGHRIVACDLDGDGKDELVVSAPGKTVTVTVTGNNNNMTYYNQGSIYAYKYIGGSFSTMASYVRDPSDSTTSYWWCNGGSTFCGGWLYPEVLSNVPSIGNGPLLGWSLSCARHAGGDRLIVGEPGYGAVNGGGGGAGGANGNSFVGRVYEMKLSGTTLAVNETITGADSNSGFGTSVQYLANFKFPGCNSGNAGEVLAIGLPTLMSQTSFMQQGAVQLFEKASGLWSSTPCATIAAQSSDPTGIGFGLTLADLGPVDPAASTDVLAIGAPGSYGGGWGGSGSCGIVRFYSNGSSTAVRALDYATNNWNCWSSPYQRFGYSIGAIGNFSGSTKSNIAISAPSATINGIMSAGAVHIYRWDDMAQNTDVGTAAAPYKTLTGTPYNNANFGAHFVALPTPGSTLSSTPDVVVVSRPNYSQIATSTTTNTWGAAPMGGAMNGFGIIDEYATTKMKIGTPFKITGQEPNEGFGRSVISLPDIDGDSISDLYIARPGGRCDGLTWGAISLYSGRDAQIFKSICAPAYGSDIGHEALYFSSSIAPYYLLVSRKETNGNFSLYSIPSVVTGQNSFLTNSAITDTGMMASTFTKLATGYKQGQVSVSAPFSYTPPGIAMPTTNYFALGIPTYSMGMSSAGAVYTVSGSSQGTTLNASCASGSAANMKLGTGVAIGSYVNQMFTTQMVTFAGAPGAATAANGATKGVVYLYNNSGANCDTTAANMGKIEADVLGGITAQSGFGSYIMTLPDLDGDNNGYELFVLVANTNLRMIDSSVTPEYFIFGINLFGQNPGTSIMPTTIPPGSDNIPYLDATILWHEIGPSGSMLGGYAKVFDDIDGGGKPDLAVAAPNGPGLYGNTGQVKILSSEKLLAGQDPVLQVIFNPEPGQSHFGVSIEFADMTGDGFKDLIIGADTYNASGVAGAGAVYVFPFVPVQQ